MIITPTSHTENAENSLDEYNLSQDSQHTINLRHNTSFITMDSLRTHTNQAQASHPTTLSASSAPEEVTRAQSASINRHASSTLRNQLWSFGSAAMFLFFLVIFSLFTSSPVTAIPLGHQDSSTRQLTHEGDFSSPNLETNLHLKPKRSTGMDQVARVIGDVGRQNYMFQSHGQLYFPELLKSSDVGMEPRVEDSNEGAGDPTTTSQKDYWASPEKVDPNRYTSFPSSVRQLNQNEILQTEEDDEGGRAGWETVIDPHLYLLTEWNSNGVQQQRKRRNVGPSLSIVNPLDVLRQRLLLEIARRKMRQTHNNQIIANAEILKNIG